MHGKCLPCYITPALVCMYGRTIQSGINKGHKAKKKSSRHLKLLLALCSFEVKSCHLPCHCGYNCGFSSRWTIPSGPSQADSLSKGPQILAEAQFVWTDRFYWGVWSSPPQELELSVPPCASMWQCLGGSPGSVFCS